MTVKIGIIGFGLRSGLWRHAHRPEQGFEVVAACDTSERGRADAVAALPETALVTADLKELLGLGLDAVLVTTPDDQHHGPTLAALEAGAAVFCEKPLGITVEECDEMLATARRTGSRLYVGHNMRHMPVVAQMRQLIHDGRIGQVKAVWCRHFVGHGGDFYFKDWHADRSRTTGLLLQKGAHDLDVIHWLAGGFATSVAAMGDLMVYGGITDRRDRMQERMGEWVSLDNWPPTAQTGLHPVVDVEDISMMTMRLDNGVLASYQQCHFTPDYWRNYTVIGTEGRLENLGDGPGDTIGLWNRRHSGHAAPDETFTVQAADGGHGGADPRLITEFLRFVTEGGTTQTSPVAARMSVAAGVVATQSLRSDGSARPVPPLAPDLIDYFERGQTEA
ncbi:oxidoreductase domain protein [Beutenbergia cavernae DSM 12333]|uniref:Oxidoreductase domain protein n=1 Tax=Beutenbergia cavernae (strain ATCC BAA-8 / DSM 12333 / CCUG 43141 / JCM 11478 / NBRC 16432 / NCIMB 13614 / HKI 0122) TaxID=471853 RepID=C5C3D4_BEUC1|nr:oxidoreductase domain protein [Beutenbergia cavernae DSM 12333]